MKFIINKLHNNVINTYSKKSWIIPLFFIFFVIILFFSPYFKIHFSNDDYIQEALPISDFASQASSQGRPLLSLIIVIANRLNINLVTHQMLIWPLVLILYGLSLFFVYKILLGKSYLKKQINWAILLLTPLTLTTWGMAEMQTFASMNLAYAFAFFFCIIAAYLLIFYNSSKILVLSFILIAISLFFYQGYISYLIPIVFLGLFTNLGYNKKFAQKNLLAVCFYSLSYFLDWTWIRFIHPHIPLLSHWTDSRTATPNVINNLIAIFKGLKIILFDSYHLFPPLIFLGFIILSIIFPIFFPLTTKNFYLKIKLILINFLFFSLIIFFSSLPHLFTGSVSYSIRSILAVAAIPVFLSILNLFNYFKILNKHSVLREKKIYFYPIIVILIFAFAYFILSFYNMQRYGQDIINVNKIDLSVAREFYSGIQKYENKSGKKIDTIYFINDLNPYDCYEKIVNCGNGVLYLKAFAVSWADIFPLNKVSGRNWNIMPFNYGKYVSKFGNKNWNAINTKEQLNFDGNNAVITVF